MANFTSGTKPLRMSVIVQMAGDALAFYPSMVEDAGLPGICFMAGIAICAKFSIMVIVGLVASHTFRCGFFVGEVARFPALWRVAAIAFFTKLSVMFIIQFMASVTFCRCVFCQAGFVALFASGFFVFAF